MKPSMAIILFCTAELSQLINSQSLQNEEENAQEEIELDIHCANCCLAVKFEMSSMNPKRLQVLYCYMSFAQTGDKSARQVLRCIAENGIELSDPDIAEVIQIKPEDECVEDIIEKKEALDSGEDYALQTDLANDKLGMLNISDSVLCATIYTTDSADPKILHEDVCFSSNTDKRIVSYSRKQNLGEQPTESDETDLVYAYFDHCSPLYRSRFEKKDMRVEIELVTFPGECHSTKYNKEVENAIINNQDFLQHFNIAIYILASIGLVGNVLTLTVCCRPSFIADQHISYYVIARCIYDTLMLIYCLVLVGFIGANLDVGSNTHEEYVDEMGKFFATFQCISFYVFFMTSELGTAFLTLIISLSSSITF